MWDEPNTQGTSSANNVPLPSTEAHPSLPRNLLAIIPVCMGHCPLLVQLCHPSYTWDSNHLLSIIPSSPWPLREKQICILCEPNLPHQSTKPKQSIKLCFCWNLELRQCLLGARTRRSHPYAGTGHHRGQLWCMWMMAHREQGRYTVETWGQGVGAAWRRQLPICWEV